jgi:hypothetical protein
MANKKNNTFGASLRATVQNSKAQTESKQAQKIKRTKKSKKTAKVKDVKPTTRPYVMFLTVPTHRLQFSRVDDMSDHEFDQLLQEAQQNNQSVQQKVPSTPDM